MANPHLGLLSGEEIRAAQIVIDGSDHLYRASTYDLSIGDIVPVDSQAKELGSSGEYRLRPGGTIRVIARESLKLPTSITGHVLLKNALCTVGVLAINIGVVDPGFEGPISSTLINFGRSEYVVKKGVPFLRVSFHRCSHSPLAAPPQRWERTAYVEKVREQVLAYSQPDFLNVNNIAKEAADGAFVIFKSQLALWITAGAFFLALIGILSPITVALADRFLGNQDKWRADAESRIEKKVSDRYSARIDELTTNINGLRKELERRPPAKEGAVARQ